MQYIIYSCLTFYLKLAGHLKERCWDGFEQGSTLITHKNFISFSNYPYVLIIFRFWLLNILDRSFQYFIFLVLYAKDLCCKTKKFLTFCECVASFSASNSLLILVGSRQKGACYPFSVTTHLQRPPSKVVIKFILSPSI
jgi:hypothetical protein